MSKNKKGPPGKKANRAMVQERAAALGVDADDLDNDQTGTAWDEKFSEFVAGLNPDTDEIKTIYAYKPEKQPNGKVIGRQVYRWRIAAGDDYPDSHDIGCAVGAGDFEIVARSGGQAVLKKRVYFGDAYNDFRDEEKAKRQLQIVQPAQTPPAAPNNQGDPFALIERLMVAAAPLAAAAMKMLNPMNQVQAMSKMGEDMARRNFDFSMGITKRANAKVLEAMEMFDDDDETDDETEGKPMSVAANGAVGWEQRLGALADMVINHGQKFVESKGPMKSMMKNAILNDSGFQELMESPGKLKGALEGLYKKCGVNLTNKVLNELGIKPPQLMKLNGKKVPA